MVKLGAVKDEKRSTKTEEVDMVNVTDTDDAEDGAPAVIEPTRPTAKKSGGGKSMFVE